jgi:hypothetical protein
LLSRDGVLLSPLYPTIGLTSALAFVISTEAVLERVRADRAGRDKAVTQRVMVQALLSLVEIRDAETGRHSRRTQQYARVLARELSTRPGYIEYLTPERIELIATLAPLHDIGKVGVPDRLLNKPGMLTEEELVEMRKHPVHGRDVILKTEQEVGVRDDVTLAIAKDIVYTHHEKWDGSGYPQGLRGNDIPIAGRLMALVDVYDAAHSRRVYQGAMQHGDVVSMIVNRRGRGCVRQRRASPATPVRASRRSIVGRAGHYVRDCPTSRNAGRLRSTISSDAVRQTRKYPGAFMMLPGMTNTSRSASADQNRSGSPSGHLDHK